MDGDILGNIILIIILVFLNGFFVAAEFAIVKVRTSQVETKSLSGSRGAKNALKVVNNLDAYLSATQLGITLASLALGSIGEPFVARWIEHFLHFINVHLPNEWLHSIASIVAIFLITILHTVLGELAPKSIAIRYPERSTLVLAAPLKAFYTIFRPFIWLLNGLANAFLRMIGVPLVHEQDSHTEDEIRLLLEKSKKSGNIGGSEHELLENVFRFDDRVAEQIMTPRTRMVAVDVENSIDDVFNTIMEEGYSRMPVYQGSVDKIIGILYTKDVLRTLKSKDTVTIRDLMREPYFVSEKKLINTLLREMQRERIQMAIVLDEFGGTSGILTMEDILEEIVGEIQDEYDNETPPVQQKSENEFIVNAFTNIDEVNKLLPEPLPESEDYETVAGFLNEIYGKIPDENEQAQNEQYAFVILKKENNTVESVLLTLLQTQRAEKAAIEFE